MKYPVRARAPFLFSFFATAGFCVGLAGAESPPKIVILDRADSYVVTLVFPPSEPKLLVFPFRREIADHALRHVDPGIVERLDSFTSPRLVESFEPNPCGKSKTPGPHVIGLAKEEDTKPRSGSRTEARAGNLAKIVEWASTLGLPVSELTRKVASDRRFSEGPTLALFSWGQAVQLELPKSEGGLPPMCWIGEKINPTETLLFLLSAKTGWELHPGPALRLPSDLLLPWFVPASFDEVYRGALATTQGQFPGAFLEYRGASDRCDPCVAPALDDPDFEALGQPVGAMRPASRVPESSREATHITRLRLRAPQGAYFSAFHFSPVPFGNDYQSVFKAVRPFEGAAACPGRSTASLVSERAALENLRVLTHWSARQIQDVEYQAQPKIVAPSSSETADRKVQWWSRFWPF